MPDNPLRSDAQKNGRLAPIHADGVVNDCTRFFGRSLGTTARTGGAFLASSSLAPGPAPARRHWPKMWARSKSGEDFRQQLIEWLIATLELARRGHDNAEVDAIIAELCALG